MHTPTSRRRPRRAGTKRLTVCLLAAVASLTVLWITTSTPPPAAHTGSEQQPTETKDLPPVPSRPTTKPQHTDKSQKSGAASKQDALPVEKVINMAKRGLSKSGLPRTPDDIHVVFSTDCRPYQLWQAVVLFHSADLVGHYGPITHLVSGCNETERATIEGNHKAWVKHPENRHQFFTKSFVYVDPETKAEFPYFNKPNAMWLWLKDRTPEETIIALVDPDFIFLKPLTTYLDPQEVAAHGNGVSIEGLGLGKGAWVREGAPAGQRFGLPEWKTLNLEEVCPEPKGLCQRVTPQIARQYYDLIPPYLAHHKDWKKILPEWVAQAPRVYKQFPHLLAEQTAYATTAATLDLPHYRINNLAVENEQVDYEDWSEIDHTMNNVCALEIKQLGLYTHLPNFIHYCHMYRVGTWLFNKRRYRKAEQYDQLSCQAPLLLDPPLDSQAQLFKLHPDGRRDIVSQKTAKRNAFVMCLATKFVNSALRTYKSAVCPLQGQQPNLAHTYRIT